jgi:hypothetical protein
MHRNSYEYSTNSSSMHTIHTGTCIIYIYIYNVIIMYTASSFAYSSFMRTPRVRMLGMRTVSIMRTRVRMLGMRTVCIHTS